MEDMKEIRIQTMKLEKALNYEEAIMAAGKKGRRC